MTETIQKLRDAIAGIYLGDPSAIDRVIRCLLARGHVLIEDVPGVGKTVLASAVARSIDCKFSRIQLTPDLLPADVLGSTIYDRTGSTFEFRRGPIFANIVLADEINRTTPRTQTALLEAMQDGSVSIEGKEHKLTEPFIVLATQNPYEFEGTYPLPENQLDRFLMRLTLGYPSAQAEADMLDIRPATTRLNTLEPVLHADDIVKLQRATDAVRIEESLREYIVAISTATRTTDRLEVGLSPRASLALAQAARATAVMDGRDYAVPEDVLDNLVAVCAHRVILRRGMGDSGWQAAAEILEELIQELEVPV
ncbi:MAG: AAA family ATPase [Planctomycetota bacterium]